MIDFTTAFAKRKIERLHFETRKNVNYFHEIVFLSSYLHDATFGVADLSFARGVVTIPLERDCWEFWTRIHRVKNRLLGCRSILTISGVRSVRWSRKRRPKTLEISSVFVGEKHFTVQDRAHLVFYSFGQKLRLDIYGGDSYFDIDLKDLDDPK